MYIEYRKCRLRRSFIFKSFWKQYCQQHISFGKRVVTVHLAVVTAHLAVVTAHLAVVTANLTVVTSRLAVVTAHLAVFTAHLAVVTAHLAVVTAYLTVVTAHLAVVTAHLAVEFVQWLKFQNNKIFSTDSLLFRTLIFWCFFGTGSELPTPWLERLEPGFGVRETKNSWFPQPPHRYGSCRIQVGDLNNICTVLLR